MFKIKIVDLLNEKGIQLNLKAKNKEEVLKELIDILEASGQLSNRDDFERAVLERENNFSTGIGMGVAIPHGKSNGVKEASIIFGRSEKGIDYQSMDEAPAYIFFLIAVPADSNNEHLNVLSQLSRSLMHSEIREGLKNAKTAQDVIGIFEQ
ncbi:putative PTS IIA-like nitrogen-regulatory protein PtsN [Alkaliphilus metalliredigens QYMF]|uniref:Putative PTS IIA-like nitrogen-regulatory protein PtsN n=1 Tax=Alkaliphilus metalliredigens (strain QYMF) TaxID=293826 RepID=A6TLI4_ALKMQ|nr:PTS sugar transporter subunit IIA [Alkaliphilus metalliredigens]ABR47052.1 putative PTS IIA-like nitrogen-regulatory protein PtsN [Alkaliphilus metalliredigens QYMF]